MLENIIKENSGLIWEISKKFYGIDKHDLYQAGILGVIKAYQNYKVDGDTKFSTYAYNYIYGEMYLLLNNKDIKLNKNIIKILKLIAKGRCKLTQVLLREPSNKELAEYLEMDVRDLEQVLMYDRCVYSLDEDKEGIRDLHEVIEDKKSSNILEHLAIDEGINSLDKLEQDIIRNRYYEDLTQRETAERLGITQVMVSRYEQRSLKKMKEFMYM